MLNGQRYERELVRFLWAHRGEVTSAERERLKRTLDVRSGGKARFVSKHI